MHILKLVVKSILHQFEAPKAKGNKVTARELAAVFDELDDDQETSGGNEGGVETNDDGLPDEQDEMSDEELIRL